MNVLFISLAGIQSVEEKGIYTDLLREFIKNRHNIYVLSPIERRMGEKTHIIEEPNVKILRLQIGNIQKTNLFEKGISTILIEPQFKAGIKKYLPDVRFDLVLYSTPPITLVSVVEYVKKRDNANTYLLLKDIFPQNAVDIGIMSKSGLKGILYKHFRRQEKKLYRISDRIGCMSQANVDYVIKHNPEVDSSIVEVCPNSVEVIDKSVDAETKKAIREKYKIPLDKKIFIYGGNLGKPQGISFIVECLRKCQDIEKAYFLIVGDGTEYGMLENYVKTEKPKNVKLMKRLPKEDYDTMVGACDVGLIFLDHRFTIPNFPSRLLSYMQAKLPVLAVTDSVTDIGKTIVDGDFGWWCESNDIDGFANEIKKIMKSDLIRAQEKEYQYLLDHYTVDEAYKIIMRHFS